MSSKAHEFYRLVKTYKIDQRRPWFEQIKIPLKLYKLEHLDEPAADFLLKKIEPWTEELQQCPIPFLIAPDADTLGSYDIEFGTLKESPGVRVGVSLNSTPRHFLLTGATGSGKSTLLRKMIIGINDYIEATGKDTVVLVINIKGDYRDLAKRFGKKKWDHYSVHHDFSMGCHPPVDCTANLNWFNQYVDLFGSIYNLEYGKSCFAKAEQITHEKINIWPSLPLILQMSKNLPWQVISEKQQYKQSFEHQLSYLLDNTGTLFAAQQGFDVVKNMILPGRSAVLDCPNFGLRHLLFLVNLIVLQLMFSRVTLMQTTNTTNFILVIDESDELCSYEASRLFKGGYSPLARVLKQGREFGIKVCLGMTNLGGCDPLITANAGELVFFQQQNAESVYEAAKTLLEPDSQTLLKYMKRGDAIFSESLGNVPYGMLIEADYVEPAKMGQPEKYDVPDTEFSKGITEYQSLMEIINKYRKPKKVENKIGIRDDSREFLDHLSLYEYEPVKCIFERMKITSPCKQGAIIKDLVNNDLIEACSFRSSSSPVRLVEITEDGWVYLNKKSKFKPLKGKIVHTHACRWIQFYFENKGLKAVCEGQIPGTNGFGDVLVSNEDALTVYEVVVECNSNILKHAHDCFVLSKKVKTMVFVTRTKSEWKKIEKKILSDSTLAFFIGRIEFELIDTFMKGVYGNESH